MDMTIKHLSKLLSEWGINEFDAKALDGSHQNSVWTVDTGVKKYVLRRARGEEIYIQEQIRILDFLKKRGFTYKIPELLSTSKRHRLRYVKHHKKFFFLYNYIPGEEVSMPVYIQQIGKLVLQFHICIKGCPLIPCFCTERVFTDKPASYLYNIARKLYDGRNPMEMQLKKIVKICQQLPAEAGALYSRLPRTICHSDFQGTNMLSDGGGNIIGLVDFGSIRTRPRICDIMYALKCIASDIGYLDEKTIKIFLSEIAEYERLTNDEKRCMYPFMIQDIALELWWYNSRILEGSCTDRHHHMIRARVNLANWLYKNQEMFMSV